LRSLGHRKRGKCDLTLGGKKGGKRFDVHYSPGTGGGKEDDRETQRPHRRKNQISSTWGGLQLNYFQRGGNNLVVPWSQKGGEKSSAAFDPAGRRDELNAPATPCKEGDAFLSGKERV